MSLKLGICVTTCRNMVHVLGLTRAARTAGIDVDIFFTGEGVNLTQEATFKELVEMARVGVCEVSFLACGYSDKAIGGLRDKDFVTQMRNAEMVAKCDRYLVL